MRLSLYSVFFSVYLCFFIIVAKVLLQRQTKTDRQRQHMQRHLGRQSSKSKQETSERGIRADKKMAYTDRQTGRHTEAEAGTRR